MAGKVVYQNVHGIEECFIIADDEPGDQSGSSKALHRPHKNVPALAATVQKTKHWIKALMRELQWEDARKAYHGLCVVLHVLRDRLTIHETADLASELPMLLRGMFYEGWQPDHVPVKDRSKAAFLTHVSEGFPNDPEVDAERLTRAVLSVLARRVSEGEINDIRAVIPESLRELFPKR
ncbi:hypothetical protein Mal15_46910 [Stieleria maiorica]|uniref:DUF2267 domain-containing protein n=1 Tax=Stieleria maiorica TaxID=2795974 RepID=A0A5B9MJK1_9BACT|nr:DUF2267 domain-containing protein [Stieleria maiorica]QEG00620.1 hypothetical protein Mal15_46910 [Stieleria maiorica]